MNSEYLSIYNNLIKLTRNKNLYLKLDRNEEFSDRLLFLMFHYALFLKKYKSLFQKEILKNNVRGTIILSAEGINGTIAGKKMILVK